MINASSKPAITAGRGGDLPGLALLYDCVADNNSLVGFRTSRVVQYIVTNQNYDPD